MNSRPNQWLQRTDSENHPASPSESGRETFAATKLFTAGCGDKPLRFLASHE
jgi:hypothetical protein